MRTRHRVLAFAVGMAILTAFHLPLSGAQAGEIGGESIAGPGIRGYAVLFLALCWPSLAIGAGFALRRGQKSGAWRLIGGMLLSIAVLWLPLFLAANTAEAYRNATDEVNRTSFGWLMYFWATYFGALALVLVMVIPARLMRSAPHAPTAATATPEAPTVPSIPTSGLAIASLVCGCLAFPLAGLSGIPGLVLGILALSSIKANEGKIGGRDLALVGIILSGASMVAFLLLFFLVPAMIMYGMDLFLHYLLRGVMS